MGDFLEPSDVYPSEHIGRVFGEVKTGEFRFFIVPLRNILLKTSDFVVLDDPLHGEWCPIIAKIVDLTHREEVSTTEKSVRTVATCKVIGQVDLRNPDKIPVYMVKYPVNPGTYVYIAKHSFIQDIFCRSREGYPLKDKLFLGWFAEKVTDENGESSKVDFYISLEELVKQHSAVLSMAGFGKTQLVTVILEEIANKYNYPVFVLDLYGEYFGVGKGKEEIKDYPFNFKVNVYTFDLRRVSDYLDVKVKDKTNYRLFRFAVLGGWLDKVEELSYLLASNKNDIEALNLLFSHVLTIHEDVLKKFGVSPFVLVVLELQRIVEQGGVQDPFTGVERKVALTLLGRVRSLVEGGLVWLGKDEKFFEAYMLDAEDRLCKAYGRTPIPKTGLKVEIPVESLSPESMVKLGQVSVFDVGSFSEDLKRRVATLVLVKLYKARLEGKIPGFFLVIEGIDRLFSEVCFMEVIRRLIDEGLRLNISVCMASQHPSKIEEVLGQVGVRFIGRLLNIEDLNCLKQVLGEEVLKEITRMGVGEWFVDGLQKFPLEQPVRIRIREKYSKI